MPYKAGYMAVMFSPLRTGSAPGQEWGYHQSAMIEAGFTNRHRRRGRRCW